MITKLGRNYHRYLYYLCRFTCNECAKQFSSIIHKQTKCATSLFYILYIPYLCTRVSNDLIRSRQRLKIEISSTRYITSTQLLKRTRALFILSKRYFLNNIQGFVGPCGERMDSSGLVHQNVCRLNEVPASNLGAAHLLTQNILAHTFYHQQTISIYFRIPTSV